MTRPPANDAAHEFWMGEALKLARRGEGATRPNPPVGAVVVRDGRRVGGGYHQQAGMPHAEVLALRDAGEDALGATLYVTLEPCSTHGRTPACTELIKASGLSRVVIGAIDPNPHHSGQGVRLLQQAGIATICGVAEAQARELIVPFARWIRDGRPHLTLKMAMTLDGRIADAAARSRWITSPPARGMVDELRRRSDAVMVGSGTACADDPSLLCRRYRNDHWRVIVDSSGRTPPGARVFNDEHAAQTILATTAQCAPRKREALTARGVQVWVLRQKQGRVSLRTLIKRLGSEGLLHVACEGGGMLAHDLVAEGLVDEFWFFVAPKLMGSEGTAAVLTGKGWSLTGGPQLKFKECRTVGPDIFVRAVPLEA